MKRVTKYFGPMVQISRLQAELNRLFAGIIETNRGSATAISTWDPSLDIVDDGETVQVIAEIPGVDASDLTLTLEGRNLTIRGNKRGRVRPRETVKFLCMERYFGSFVKAISLHVPVNPNKARAVMADGVLTITLPRVPDLRRKVAEISVQVEEPSR